jgi:hypothetical protein
MPTPTREQAASIEDPLGGVAGGHGVLQHRPDRAPPLLGAVLEALTTSRSVGSSLTSPGSAARVTGIGEVAEAQLDQQAQVVAQPAGRRQRRVRRGEQRVVAAEDRRGDEPRLRAPAPGDRPDVDAAAPRDLLDGEGLPGAGGVTFRTASPAPTRSSTLQMPSLPASRCERTERTERTSAVGQSRADGPSGHLGA